MEIRPLRIADIDESPTNPRKHFDPAKLNELAASIQERGVQQPIKVRTKGKRLELIFGARRLRASKIAKLTEIPGIVEEMDDAAVCELQLMENAQREDVHPLDEADAYRELNSKHGRAIEQIAARVGKSPSHIYARLRLCKLGERGRKAFLEDKIDTRTALLLAGIADADLQEKAAKEVAEGDYNGEPMRYSEALDHVRRNYMLVLAKATFAIADANLVPAAGACTTCPKRTGNQKELFADVGKVDHCTDPTCFQKKTDAAWIQISEAAAKNGSRVLTDKESRKLFPYGDHLTHGTGYLDLSAKSYEDKKGRTYEQIFGKKTIDDLQVVIARDANGSAHRLVDAKEAAKHLRAKGADVPYELRPKPKSSSSSSSGNDEKAYREKQRQGREFRLEVLTALIAQADKDGSSPGFWRTLARGAHAVAHSETMDTVAKRRGLVEKSRGRGHEALKKEVDGFDQRQAALFVLEVLLTQSSLYVDGDKLPESITRAAEDLGVDVKKIRASMIAKAAEERRNKAK